MEAAVSRGGARVDWAHDKYYDDLWRCEELVVVFVGDWMTPLLLKIQCGIWAIESVD